MALDDPLISPMYANLSVSLAPTFIVTAGHDLLHDENYPKQTHGFINLTPVSKQAKKRSIEMALGFKKFWRQYD